MGTWGGLISGLCLSLKSYTGSSSAGLLRETVSGRWWWWWGPKANIACKSGAAFLFHKLFYLFVCSCFSRLIHSLFLRLSLDTI